MTVPSVSKAFPGESGVPAVTERIVIADDDDAIRRLVSLVLRRKGYEVSEATTGDQALELIRREHPNLAILDIMMPGLSGLDVLRELTSDTQTAGIPVLLLTAKGEPRDVATGAGLGARAYILKPFRVGDLIRRVDTALGHEDW